MRSFLYALFAVGLVLKVLHLPYHTVFLLIVLGAMLLHGLVQLIRHPKERANTIAHLAITTWLFHLVALLKLFPFQPISVAAAVGMTGVALFLSWRLHSASRTSLVAMAVVATAVLVVMAVPAPSRYHATVLRFSMERDTDVHSWDKYSFLLLRHGDVSEALHAQAKAVAAAQRAQRTDLLPALQAHTAAIRANDWPHYGPLPH